MDGETAAPAKAKLPDSEPDELSDGEYLGILREVDDWQANAGSSACLMSDVGTRRMLQDAMDEDDNVNGPSRPPPAASAEGGDAAPGVPQVRNPLHTLRRAAPCGTHNGRKGRCDIAERQWKPGACVCV